MNIALDRVILEWIHIKSPDSSTRHSCLSNAFVDDTSLEYIDHGFLVTLKTMITKLNNIAQPKSGGRRCCSTREER
jgi:hypothetical protein